MPIKPFYDWLGDQDLEVGRVEGYQDDDNRLAFRIVALDGAETGALIDTYLALVRGEEESAAHFVDNLRAEVRTLRSGSLRVAAAEKSHGRVTPTKDYLVGHVEGQAAGYAQVLMLLGEEVPDEGEHH